VDPYAACVKNAFAIAAAVSIAWFGTAVETDHVGRRG
jgi:hypothetical protein